MIGFENKRGNGDFFNTTILGVQAELDNEQTTRLTKIRQAWNFYEGYHWEDIPVQDSPELTVNYCRAFVNKFVSFELGKGFTMSLDKVMQEVYVVGDNAENGKTTIQYLEEVWEDNKKDILVTEIGQTKSITGDAWVQVRFIPPKDLSDPFGKYPNGRIRIMLLPTSTVFPKYNPHDKDELESITIMYMFKKIVKTPFLGREKEEELLFKQTWTKDTVVTREGREEPKELPNKYGIIPIVHIKNLPLAGKTDGLSDLEDIIPLNSEYNMKNSDISEIIDYHAAPITVVYGAKIGNLEKGANKMWGGLAKDAKVENLELKSDLTASTTYTGNLKLSMCEISGIPETVLGGAQAISNTSGVALQYINLPLIEKTRIKRSCTMDGLVELNSLILLMSGLEGLITKPEGIANSDFYKTEIIIPDTLPKDPLMELQQLQAQMKAGLQSRENGMKILGIEDIDIPGLMEDIDEDAEKNPEWYGKQPLNPFGQQQPGQEQKINSGMTNGENPIEQVRKEVTGANGGAPQ